MAERDEARANHRRHIEQRTQHVRGKRGPVAFVWGNHVVKARQRVPGAPGLWSPLPAGWERELSHSSATAGVLAIPGALFMHRAVLYASDHRPFADRNLR